VGGAEGVGLAGFCEGRFTLAFALGAGVVLAAGVTAELATLEVDCWPPVPQPDITKAAKRAAMLISFGKKERWICI